MVTTRICDKDDLSALYDVVAFNDRTWLFAIKPAFKKTPRNGPTDNAARYPR